MVEGLQKAVLPPFFSYNLYTVEPLREISEILRAPSSLCFWFSNSTSFYKKDCNIET